MEAVQKGCHWEGEVMEPNNMVLEVDWEAARLVERNLIFGKY